MVGNIIPYIGGEEEKSEKEPLRLWGKVEDGVIVPAQSPVITCQCIRVPVLNGHTAAVFVKFKKKPTKEELIDRLVHFSGEPQRLELPSAPKQFIQYLDCLLYTSDLDEDEMLKFLSSTFDACPYYRSGDEYSVVRHQM